MERHQDGAGIPDGDRSLCLTSRVRVIKEDSGEWMLLEINCLAIHVGDLEVKHGSIASDLEGLRCVVVTSKDQVFGLSSLFCWVETHVDISCCTRIQIELRRLESEWSNPDLVRVSLFRIILISLAEEPEASITSCVDASESHVGLVSDP